MYTNHSIQQDHPGITCIRHHNCPSETIVQWHDCYELFFLADGDIHFYLEQYRIHIRPGCGVFFHPRLLHRYQVPHNNPWNAFSLMNETNYLHSLSTMQTNLEKIFLLSTSLPFFSFCLKEDIRSSFQDKCHILQDSFRHTGYGSDILKECALKELLLYLNMLPSRQVNRKKDLLQIPSLIAQSLPYILNHPTSDLSLKTLSVLFHHSEDYINQLFLQHLGISPSEYVLLKRLHLACGYLTAGYPPAYTCKTCGFTNYGNFCKTFHHHIGTTPSAYQLCTMT